MAHIYSKEKEKVTAALNSFLLSILQSEISSHESYIVAVSSTGEGMVSEGHFGAEEIQRKISQLKTKWQQLKVCLSVCLSVCMCVCVCVCVCVVCHELYNTRICRHNYATVFLASFPACVQ